MTEFDPELAEIRFGCGLSPVVAPVANRQAMLDGLTAPDTMLDRFPIETFPQFRTRMVEAQALRKQRRKVRGTPEGEALRKQVNLLKKDARESKVRWLGQTMLRRTYTDTGFRERVTFFWADHFTAHGKAGVIKRATSPYIDSAIRPNITGRFADLLIKTVMHPLMLDYLDQARSMGPNSPQAERRGAKAGINENLAREVLELHTLGVGGPYTQTDVRELAELFTGLTFAAKQGFKFRKDFAEPGAETVMGTTYSEKPSLEPILAALEDLAAHPATARHIAQKMAVHFVSDTPDPALIEHIEARFNDTGGDLSALYEALLEHPSSWSETAPNAKLPSDFVGSTLRALAVSPERIQAMDEKIGRMTFVGPMRLMGQKWQEPIGPDGWPEEDSNWITAQSLSARIRWAMAAPETLMPDLPDPRSFAQTALGARASDVIKFAAASAESKPEAIGLVLSSPAFQRR
ncbi:MAG: DUF1800 domain-containing protein [Aliishimia sp.]